MSIAQGADRPGFPRLWLGQSVSLLGSQVTLVALPLTGVLTLHAGPTQMGALRVASTLPFLLFGLLAGAWVDRRSRLTVMSLSSLGQALLLAFIPALALAGRLQIELVYAIAFLVGGLTVLFDVAYQAFVPSLVRSEHLLHANSRLETSRSLVQVIGPSVGGLLVQALTAPVAILADVASFLFAAVTLRTIPDPETPPVAADRSSLLHEVWEGLGALLGHPVLRAIATATTLSNLTVALATPVLFLFMIRTLHLSPTLVGTALAVNGLGGVCGALAGPAAARRLPIPVILALALVVAGAGTLLVASAVGSASLVVTLVFAGEAALGFALPFYNVSQLSLRQALTPARLQARVHASSRTLTWAALPVGAVVGGVLGEHLGLRSTLVVSGAGTMATALVAYVGVRLATRSAPARLTD
jgi:predicted MFS family arabinose efflux permease